MSDVDRYFARRALALEVVETFLTVPLSASFPGNQVIRDFFFDYLLDLLSCWRREASVSATEDPELIPSDPDGAWQDLEEDCLAQPDASSVRCVQGAETVPGAMGRLFAAGAVWGCLRAITHLEKEVST